MICSGRFEPDDSLDFLLEFSESAEDSPSSLERFRFAARTSLADIDERLALDVEYRRRSDDGIKMLLVEEDKLIRSGSEGDISREDESGEDASLSFSILASFRSMAGGSVGDSIGGSEIFEDTSVVEVGGLEG